MCDLGRPQENLTGPGCVAGARET